MSRPQRIALIVLGSVAGLVLVLFVAGIVVIQTPWFRNMVRQKIVTSIENATGGTAQVGSFVFHWTHLRAVVHDLVLHGLEPAGAAPLFHARLVQVDLSLASPFTGFVHIASLVVDQPRAGIIVFPDGHTNVPSPKAPSTGKHNALQTVVNLAVGHFDLSNGSIALADRKIDFAAHGENLRAQLAYDRSRASYSGEVDMSPLHLESGGGTAVDANVKLPVAIEANRVMLSGASVTTPASRIAVSATLANMAAPIVSGHIAAHVSLEEAGRAAGLKLALDTADAPRFLNADVTGSLGQDGLQVENAKLDLGHTTLRASGTAPGANRPANIRFDGSLALGQIGRLFRVSAQPEGTVHIGGNATVQSLEDYNVAANIAGQDLAFREKQSRVSGVSLHAALTAAPARVELGGIRLEAFGGNFTGAATVQNASQFRIAGDLHHFDIERFAQAFLHRNLGVQGDVSGPIEAAGPVSKPSDLTLRASLSIGDPPQVPIRGRVDLTYNGKSGALTFAPSHIQLAHTTIDISGSLATRLEVRVVSHDLADLRRFATLPMNLSGGSGVVNLTATGTLSAPHLAGQIALADFRAENRRFSRLTAAIDLSKSHATISKAVLTRGPLLAEFTAAVGLRDWKPLQSQPLRVDGVVRSGQIQDILALAGRTDIPFTGALTANVHVTGTVGSPTGDADFTIANGTLEGGPFDTISAHAVMTRNTIDIPTIQYVAGPARMDASATYQHVIDHLDSGALRARVTANRVQLARFQAVVKSYSGFGGTVSANADMAADIRPSQSGAQFQLTTLNGTVSARSLQIQGQALGDFTATAKTAASTLHYAANSNFAGSTIRVNGQTLLTGDHQTTASADISNLPMVRVLAVAGRGDIPFAGTLSASARLNGTLQNPHADATVAIAKGSAYQEPFDSLEAGLSYSNQSIDLSRFQLVKAGGATVQLAGSFTHPSGDYRQGQLRFQMHSNQLQLSQFHTVQRYKPGLAGIVQVSADGAARLRPNAAPLFSSLNADIQASRLAIGATTLGSLTATAGTRGGEVALRLTSDLAGANIRGDGALRLAGDYPLSARLDFSNLTYAGLRGVIGAPEEPISASTEGFVTVSGPLVRTNALRGRLELTKFEARGAPAATGLPPRVQFDLHNAAPIVLAIDRSVVTVQSGHITGPFTDVALSGTASLAAPHTVNLRADGHLQLRFLEAFSPNIFSAGTVTLNSAITGTLPKPAINGRLELQNASFNLLGLPAGLDHATGAIVFTGTQANIQNLTAESGGGKVTLAGYVAYGGPLMQFRVQATAAHVRVDYPESVTTQASAKIVLAGTSASSLLSGSVSVEDVALHARTDIGSLLTSPGAPTPAPSGPRRGLLGGMRFDVRILTSPGVQFRTTLTENLQADANVTLRGTPDQPGMLGRIVITQGSVIFFGNPYTINTGTIAFYDPHKVAPNLNIHLETKVQGIDVTIGVSGPMDRLKLAYRSDPPLQFTQIVSLLAAGTPPTTDPVLAARQPAAPQQNFEQAGASTLLGQAVTNPVAGRLQRLFGVSKLSINPEITGPTNTAQATITLQQQVTPDITFTYIQDVAQANAEVLRVQWALNPQWTAVAQRDIYGEFDLDFYYKKRFH